MKLVDHLKAYCDTAHPFSRTSLKLFSGLDSQAVSALWDDWQRIPSRRRIEIVHAFLEMAEDNIDMDFRQMFFLCLNDPNDDVRASAIDGLWEDEHIQTLHRLLELVNDPSGKVREMLMMTLSHFAYLAEVGDLPAAESERILSTLLQIIGDQKQPLAVRRRALESAGYFAESAEVQAEISRAYSYPEQTMRESALVAMGRSMLPEWFPYIERELQSISPALRYEAARAVGELAEDGMSLLSALLPLVEDEDNEVAQAAIWALGQVGGPQAYRVLQRLSHSKNWHRSQAASEALEELSMLDDEHF